MLVNRVLPLCAVIFLLAGCGAPTVSVVPTPTPSCNEQAASFVSDIQPLFQEWTDATTLAGQTPRVALAGQIETLQAIRRKAESVAAPSCAQPAHEYLSASMDASINGYLAFLGQQNQRTVDSHFAVASDYLAAFSDDIAQLRGDTPIIDLPPAVVYSDGLQVSREAMTAQVDGLTFVERTLASGETALTGRTKTQDRVLELIGPAANVRHISYIASLTDDTAKDVAQRDARALMTAAMPDWKDAEAWITAAYRDIQQAPQTTIINGRVVHIEQQGFGNTLTMLLTIEVP